MEEYSYLNSLHSWPDTNQFIPPEEPGVYFIYYALHHEILGTSCELLYIGSTKNLRKRLSNHEVVRPLQHPEMVRITYHTCQDYRRIEKEAIVMFSPLANIQFNR